MHAKAFEYGKHDNLSKHAKNIRKVKNAYPTKFDHACVANNVEKKSINDIIVNQVVEELYSRFNIVVKENLDDVHVCPPKTKFVKVSWIDTPITCSHEDSQAKRTHKKGEGFVFGENSLRRTQRAPSWKGLHTLVVKPPNVGKGYVIVMSESRHEVYMFMLEKSKKC
ncbi:hypothetical protein Q3G72_018515 [Acer saccharum]|nr:hypothetical protein Q3G72_018515 [Acer saccharum]